MASFLSGIGRALRAPGLGDRLQAAFAAAGGDTSAIQRLRALQLQQAELQRQNDARDAQVIGAKNMGFGNDEIGAMSPQDLSAAARQLAALRAFGSGASAGGGGGEEALSPDPTYVSSGEPGGDQPQSRSPNLAAPFGYAQPPFASDRSGPQLDRTAAVKQAAAAIQGGADPKAVRARLNQVGRDDGNLDPSDPFSDLMPGGRQASGAMFPSDVARQEMLPADQPLFTRDSIPGRQDLNRGAAAAAGGDGARAGFDRASAIQHAADAIQRGADPDAVHARLIQMGQGGQEPPSPFSDLMPGGRPGTIGDSAPPPMPAQPAFDNRGGFAPRAAAPGFAQGSLAKLPQSLDPRLAPQKAGELRKGGASDAGQTTLFTNGSPPLLGDGQARRGSPTAEPAGGPNRGLNWVASAVGRRIPPPAPWREGGRWNRQTVDQRAARAVRMYKLDVARGMRPELAAGWAASSEAESGGDYLFHQPHGPGVGLYQWSSNGPRDAAFRHLFGHPIDQSTEDEQLRFRDWELAHSEARAAAMIARARTAGDVGDAITRYFESPKQKDRDAADRANVAEAIRRLLAQSHIAPDRTGQQTQGILGSGSAPAR